MFRSLFFSLALACAGGASRAVEQGHGVPAAFVGEWNVHVARCGTSDGDGRLIIRPGRVEFYESAGPVVRVLVESPDQIVVIAQLQGEGQVMRSVRRWRLSSDRQLLIDEPGAGGLARHRCRPGAATQP